MLNLKKAALFSSVSGFFNKMIALASVIIVARLLTPAEIGIYVIAAAFTLIASEVRLLGINAYIIREKSIDRDKVQRCIGVATLLCFSIGTVLLLLAYPVSVFYKTEDIHLLLSLLSISFFTVPFISATNAILTRNFLFGKVMVMQNIGPLVGLITTVVLIHYGFSYFSLALGQVAITFTNLIVAYLLKPSWVTWHPKFNKLKEIVTIGMYTSGIQLLQKVQTLVPDLVLGRMSSSAYTATFSRAMGFQLFINDLLLMGIRGFALSYLSKNSENKEELKYAYLKSSDLVHCFVLPPLASAIILSETLILAMFGKQWYESIFIAKLLGIWMMFRVLHQMTIPLLISMKKEKTLFKSRLAIFTAFVIGITSVAWLSPMHIIYVFVAVGCVDSIVLFAHLKKELGLGVAKFIKNSSKAFLVTGVCALVSLLITLGIAPAANIFTTLIVAIAILGLTYLVMIRLVKHPLSDIVFEILKKATFKQNRV